MQLCVRLEYLELIRVQVLHHMVSRQRTVRAEEIRECALLEFALA